MQRLSTVFALLVLVGVFSIASAQPVTPQAPQYRTTINLPDDIGINITDAKYGAKGDGVTDDTAAILKALARPEKDGDGKIIDYFGRPRLLYFPPGTYLVSDTLEWVGCCMWLQGAGSGQTIIKLKNSARGYGDPSKPKPVIYAAQAEGNKAFRHYIMDMTIDTGSGNPGATGIDFIASNIGAVKNVVIRSGDGQGKVGLDMTRPGPGPLLIRDVTISGFDIGIDITHREYGPTFENITLTNLKKVGIRNENNILAIRNLYTDLSVPAIRSFGGTASLILLDSRLVGGSGNDVAIEAERNVFLRDVTTSGYQAALKVEDTVVPGTAHTEYNAGQTYTLGETGQTTSLDLPIAEVPSFHDNNLDNWVKFDSSNYDSAGHNLTALKEALAAGKPTIYFANGASLWAGEVTVPATVRRIVGFGHAINNYDGTSLTLRIEEPSDVPLIIEGFGYGLKIEHGANRPLVLKHSYFYKYVDEPGAGALYLDDVILPPVTFKHTPNVWARQLNTEGSGDTPRITNDGTNLWILGIKTEGDSTVIETKNGGRTELFGTLVYPAKTVPGSRAALINDESDMSAIISYSNYEPSNGIFPVMVRERRGAVTRELMTEALGQRTLPLYVGTRPGFGTDELLTNGGFEFVGATKKTAAKWKFKIGTAKRKCHKPEKAHFAYRESCVLQGKPGAKVKQKARAMGAAGDTLTLSAMVESKGAAKANIRLKITYTDGTKGKLKLNKAEIGGAAYPYKLVSNSVTLIGTPKKLKLEIRVKRGRLYMDNISLKHAAGSSTLSTGGTGNTFMR